MSLTVVLSVGSDRLLLESRNLLLRFAGYSVVAAFSVASAVRRFHEGDFDLVLLDHSLPIRDREFVARSIRTYGSRVPVLSICPGFDEGAMGASATVMNDPSSFLTGVRDALARSASTVPSVPVFVSSLRDMRPSATLLA